ncbi:MAG: hypothetical protein OEL78_04415 [Hyphomicrobiales bacterium]|nr:hypothetical protein [Hyphomicrobiales bacterium]
MTSGRSDLVEIACTVIHQTGRAVLIHDGTRKVWLPLSACEIDFQAGTVTLPESLAHEKELI